MTSTGSRESSDQKCIIGSGIFVGVNGKACENGMQVEEKHLEVVLEEEHTQVHVLEVVLQVEKSWAKGNDATT